MVILSTKRNLMEMSAGLHFLLFSVFLQPLPTMPLVNPAVPCNHHEPL